MAKIVYNACYGGFERALAVALGAQEISYRDLPAWLKQRGRR